MTLTGLLILAAFSLALGIQLLTLRTDPGAPVGDEGEYLDRAGRPDPLAPEPFLRVPLLPAACWLLHFLGLPPRKAMALVGSMITAITVACTCAAASMAAGPVAGMFAGLLLLAQPERVILASRLWPDVWLGLWVASAILLVTNAGVHSLVPLTTFALATLALLTRLDGAALGIGLSAASLVLDASLTSTVAPLVALAGASGFLSLRNWYRYGIPLPDDTWAFNLQVRRELNRLGGKSIRACVRSTLAKWLAQPAASRWKGSPEPVREGTGWLGGLLFRIAIYFGPDQFVRPSLLKSPPPLLAMALSFSFPSLVAIAFLTFAADDRGTIAVVCVGLPLVLVAVSAHTLTRYRVATMPVLAYLAGVGLARGLEGGAGWPAGFGRVVLVISFLVAAAKLGRDSLESS